MPAKKQITREIVTEAALTLVRERGIDAVNAREVAGRVGCSTQPIYLAFSGMEELKRELILRAERYYQQLVAEETASQKYPPYKAFGMAYIRFAKEEKELFKLLYMRDRSKEAATDDDHSLDNVIALILKSTELDPEQARLLHLETWAWVHGVASMMATGFLELDVELISRMLTDVYQGLLHRHAPNAIH